MKVKKNSKAQSKNSAKKVLRIENQEHEEIINEDEIRNRNGFIGEKKYFFIAYLRAYFHSEVYHNFENNLTGLAESIYSKKLFYAKTDSGYKLLKFRTIEDYLHQLSKEVQKELAQELKEKEKYKSRK